MRSILLSIFLSAALFHHNAMAAAEWSGSMNTRFTHRVQNDGLSTKNASGKDTSQTTTRAYQMRANLGLLNKGEMVDFGFGLRTYSSPSSEWLTVNNSADILQSIEQAYAKAHTEIFGGEGSVSIGRQKTVILNDTVAQILFDKDVRWDGLGWSFKRENYGFNMAQYVMGARNSGAVSSSSFSTTESSQAVASTRGGFAMLYSFQPHMKFKVSEEIEAQVAVAYHMWQGTSGFYTNTIHGGTTATADRSTDPLVLDNSRQWHLYTIWNLPMNFKFSGEYVRNKKLVYGTRTAPTTREASIDGYGLTLLYGQAKKAGDFSLSYSYLNKGLGASINTFSNSDMNADNVAHFFEGKYALADNFTLAAKAQFLTEKSKLSGDGLAETSPNQARKQSSKKYELVAGVAF